MPSTPGGPLLLRARVAAVAALATAVTMAPGALAAPRACRLLTDPAGDDRATTDHTSTPYTDDLYDSTDLDIVGGDIATNAKDMTVVVRLKTLRETDPDSPTGRSWEFWFTAGEERFGFATHVAPDGAGRGAVFHQLADYEEGGTGATTAEGIGRAKVVYDFRRAEIRMTAPLSVFAPYTEIRQGTVLFDLLAIAYHFYGSGGGRHDLPAPEGWVVDHGGGGASSSVDLARSAKRYASGTPSCVAVGR